ncbi:hypothetical protein FGU46_09415 [Methanobacterium sp. CWC-01]|uniref:hypothetical protein n=1 Tax=Methanobacterium aridiramus TaxID=2584467 RepID=UPI002577B609|nr:hypothetical protein [Methanobacterium sp. CWC-01]WJI10289.1 hypothetical protein FGU46_09415 [Methanobacterium sp. CWC-01]
MNRKIIILILALVSVLISAGGVSAHPGHGEPIEVPSEPAEPTEPDTGTTDTSTSDTTTSSTTTSTGSGSTGTASAPTETATSSSADTGTENSGEVDIYPGDSEDINSSWPMAALFGVAAVLGAVGVYYRGDRFGL